MGKKRASKKAGAEDYDDAGSLCSTSTAACSMGEAGDTYLDAQAQALSTAIDDTYESRSTTREKAWERIVALLRNTVRLDDCYQSASTLTSRCVGAIRKGGPAEAASAATALALHWVTLGEPNESMFQEGLPDLVRATKYGKGPAVKVAAVDALVLCCFVGAEDEHTTLEVMSHLQTLWRKDGAKLRAAALRGWALLYTSLNTQLSSRQLETFMAGFAELLHDPEVEVRAAAGEGLALLYHTSGLADGNCEGFEGYDEESDDALDEISEEGEEHEQQRQQQEVVVHEAAAADQQQPSTADIIPQLQQAQQQQHPDLPSVCAAPAGDGSSNTDSSTALTPVTLAAAAAAASGKVVPRRREGDDMSLASCSSVSGLDLVVDRMKDLASNRGDKQRRNKRERSVLKGTFRELRGIMEDGRVPEQKIKLRHGDSLLIDTLEGNTMMNWLKRFLAGGFQVHLQGNPFLHAVFGFSPLESRPDRLTAQEKRCFRSPSSAASKARSQTRRSERAFKDHGGGGW